MTDAALFARLDELLADADALARELEPRLRGRGVRRSGLIRTVERANTASHRAQLLLKSVAQGFRQEG